MSNQKIPLGLVSFRASFVIKRRRRLTCIPAMQKIKRLSLSLLAALVMLALNLSVFAFQPLPPTSRLTHNACAMKDGTFHHQSRIIRVHVDGATDTSTTDSSSIETLSVVTEDANGLMAANGHYEPQNGVWNQTSVNGMSNQTEAVNGLSFASTNNNNSTVDEVPLPTVNGGYSHTTASRAKISAANKGKVPWNKGKTRSPQERARIAAGVRAKNRQRFLEKLASLGLTEEEYNEQKKAERREKDRERRARRTAKGGYRPTEETKQKISTILKEKWAKGEMKKRTVNPEKVRRGFTHSAETRAKISASLKKRWANDPDYRNAMMQKCNTSNASDDVKQRISASLKKKWQDPDFRQEMLQKMANRQRTSGPHALTHREKISAAMKKKWHDEEYRKKTLAGIQKSQASKPKTARPKARKPKKRAPTTPIATAVTAVQPVDAIRIATPVQPKKKVTTSLQKKKPVKRATPTPATVATKKRTTKKRAPRKVEPVVASKPATPTTDEESLLLQKLEEERAAALKAEPDGSINRLREERRDLYDLLYGEDGASSAAVLDLGDENLDTFDPYGLEDF